MIIARIDGPLERQLAQYLFGAECAHRLHAELKLDLSAFGEEEPTGCQLSHFALPQVAASAPEVSAAKHFGILSQTSQHPASSFWETVRDGLYLDGEWADFRYYEASIARLALGLTLDSALSASHAECLAAIGACESVALDLTAPRSGISLLPPSYFEEAIREIRIRVPDAHLFVFTPEPAEFEQTFAEAAPYTLVKTAAPLPDIACLQLMSVCKHRIVGTGGLSALAALLAAQEGAVTIAPQQTVALDDKALLAKYGKVEQPVWPPTWQVLPLRVPRSLPPCPIHGGRSFNKPIRVAVWNFYEEITTNGFLFKNPEAPIGANLLKPWVDLYEYGQANGILFFTLDQLTRLDEMDAILFMDRPRAGNPRVDQVMQCPDIAKYLLTFESEVIKPDNWDKEYHQEFDRIFTWSDTHADGRRYVKIHYAIDTFSPYDFGVLKSAFTQRKLATIIAGAKHSVHAFELYSHRLRCIRWFEASAPQDFDLYGGGWDKASFPSYRGKVHDKLATLSHYRFAICYENAKCIPGYITEKILDCFRAGTVPVYGGAPNITRWIPADCFIDIAQFPTYDHLYAYLRDMDEATHAGYLDRIERFFASEKAYPFSSECFVATVSNFIAFDVLTRRGEAPAEAPTERTPGTALALIQDQDTLAIRVVEEPIPIIPPAITLTPKETIAAATHPDLIVYLGYGYELPVYKQARALWEFYMSHFPNIKVFFVRNTDTLPRGEMVHNEYDLLVGIGNDGPKDDEGGYRKTGVWSASENSGVIFKQCAVYDYVLRKYDKPFHLYFSTITSVVDFRGLLAVLDSLPKTRCFAGQPGRLATPPELNRLAFICGTNTLLSRDMVERLRNNYDPHHPWTKYPNDIWQSLMLEDVPRIPVPYFSFVQPRKPGSDLSEVARLTRRLLADGHFHFRVKTTCPEDGSVQREDIDPWVMLKIMETILSSPGSPQKNRDLVAAFLAFTGGSPEGYSAYPETFFAGPRFFALADEEALLLYPA